MSVVAVTDAERRTSWACESHAADALQAIKGAKIDKVSDWDAARRLLELPWNKRSGFGPGVAS